MTTPSQCHLWQKNHLVKEDLSFDTVKTLIESSHLDRSVLKCKQCGQLYFYEFYEEVDWANGDDKIYTTYIPIEEQDIEKLENNSPLELLGRVPRLQWDNNNNIVWIGKGNKQDKITAQQLVDSLNRSVLQEQEKAERGAKRHRSKLFWLNLIWLIPLTLYATGFEIVMLSDFVKGIVTLFHVYGLKAFGVIIFIPSFYVWLILSIGLVSYPPIGMYLLTKALFDDRTSKKQILFVAIFTVLMMVIVELLFSFLADKSYPLGYDAHDHMYLRLFPFM